MSFLLFLHRKGIILSRIPNSKVVLLRFIVLQNKSQQPHATISCTKKLRRNDPENITTQGLTFNTGCRNCNLSIRKVKMATAMLPLFEPAKRGNSDSVLKTQQSLHSQKLRTIVVQKYHLRVSAVIFDAPRIS